MNKKFFKLYKAPGYPVDPKLEAERQAVKLQAVTHVVGKLIQEKLSSKPAVIVATSLQDGHHFLLECERQLTGSGKN